MFGPTVISKSMTNHIKMVQKVEQGCCWSNFPMIAGFFLVVVFFFFFFLPFCCVQTQW